MENAALTRQHEPRRPSRWALTLAFSLVTGGAIAGAAWATWLAKASPESIVIPVTATVPAQAPAASEVVVVEPMCPAPPPAPVVIVPAAPDPRFGTGSCPGRDAPRDPAIGAPWQPNTSTDETSRILDGTVFVGVAASARKHGHLAAWSRDSVFYSDSDGRTFREVLHGPGQIYDAAVDCRGAVFVVRGSDQGFMLGYAHAREQWWRPIHMRDTQYNSPYNESEHSFGEVSLSVGGGWLAIKAPVDFFSLPHEDAHHALAVSRDGGASWSFPKIPDDGGIEYVHVASIDDYGRMRMLGLEGDCKYEGTSLQTIQLATGDVVTQKQLSLSYQLITTMSHRWAYSSQGCHGPLCALDMRNIVRDEYEGTIRWKPVTGFSAQRRVGDTAHEGQEEMDERAASVYENGRVYARLGKHIFRLRGRKATRIGDQISDTVEFRAMDSSYRLIGLSRGALVRWSPRHGVRAIRGQDIE